MERYWSLIQFNLGLELQIEQIQAGWLMFLRTEG